MTEIPYFNQLAISQILQQNYKIDPLDENPLFIEKELSFYVFLPSAFNDDNYNQICRAGLDTNLDKVVDQNNKFSQRKSTNLFIYGYQESPEDVAAGITNFINISLFIINESNGTPLIIKML